jgi:catechol 2,3-dioxygenase-like lactoylglutathione lyase family enzyme
MLPVGDMDRAVSFYRDVVGLTLEFQSPFWTELRWREATIALHGGGSGEERESWLGFHVADLDAALAEIEAAVSRQHCKCVTTVRAA